VKLWKQAAELDLAVQLHFERARTFIAHLSMAEQAQIMGGNAVRLFDFEP